MRYTLCGVSFVQRIKVISHYEDNYGIEIQSENLQFHTVKEFLEWKISAETNRTYKFRKRSCHKNKKSIYLFCIPVIDRELI